MKQVFRSIVAVGTALFTLPALASEPVAPSDVKAESTPDGVVITWQPVSEDVDENPVDPEEVIYDVYRCDASDEKVLVGEDLVETTYTDVIGEVTGEVFYRWQVIAKSADGSSSSYEGYSPTLSFGDGASLPYVETFNTKSGWSMGPDNYWLADNGGGWDGFDVDTELYSDLTDEGFYVYGADYTEEKEDGFLYFEPSKWSASDVSYTSGNINLSDAVNPVLSFKHYVFPTAHNNFQVSLLDAEGNTHELHNATPDGEKFGWKDNEYPLSAFKGQKVRIQVHTAYNPDAAPDSGVRAPICLDSFKVADTTPSGVVGVTGNLAGETTYYSIDGRRLTAPVSGQLVIKVQREADGKVSATKELVR